MIHDYRGLAVFVAVAEAGSFSEAGRRLKLSTSVISHHVSNLEEKLGASLLFRSTRSLSLTSEGKAILVEARKMVNAGQAALDTLAEDSEQPVGSLRISAPAFGERSTIHKMVWDFAVKHPMVAVSLHSSGKQIDLIKDGFDMAIRLGTLRDSAMMSKKLGEFQRVIVTSPKYLKGRSEPITIDNISDCDFVSVAMLGDEFTLFNDDRQVVVKPENIRIEVDSAMAAKSAIFAGLGMRALPISEIETELATGELVRILPDWQSQATNIYAVWPDLGPQKKLTRRFIDFLAQRFQQKLQ